MIGEIRDSETSDIAIQAALTGHLVFSTVHTNDAPGAVTRLMDMGVESFLISSALLGVMAQRLVRVICPNCKEETPLTNAYRKEMGSIAQNIQNIYRGVGCDHCSQTGYRGRIGIYELMVVNDAIRGLIVEKSSSHIIRNKAREMGMTILREDGWRKVTQGITTPEEVLRVTLNNEL